MSLWAEKNAKAAQAFAGAALVSKEKRSMDEKTWGPCLGSGPCSLPEDTYSISGDCDKEVKEFSRNCKRNRNKLEIVKLSEEGKNNKIPRNLMQKCAVYGIMKKRLSQAASGRSAVR